jgi:hypothetical protein
VHDKRFVFCIVTARYNIYLEAGSHEEMLGWMCSIDEVKMVRPHVPHVPHFNQRLYYSRVALSLALSERACVSVCLIRKWWREETLQSDRGCRR